MSDDNRILFAGDPHGEFDNIISSVVRHLPKAVVILGDFALTKSLESYLKPIADMTEVWWIYGNHDVNGKAAFGYLFHSSYKNNDLHLKVREIAGLKIAGLGGIFMAKNWYPPNRSRWRNQHHWLTAQPPELQTAGMPIKVKHSIWQHEVERMRSSVKADILVTHEAPSCHRYGFSAIDELAQAIGAKHIFHGHQHEYYQACVPGDIAVTGVAKQMVVNLAGFNLNQDEMIYDIG